MPSLKTISCAIVDDETNAIELLKDSLALLNKNIEVTDTYTTWAKALEGLRAKEYDLLLLDISLHDKNGMDLLKYIPGLQSEVIFITAHAAHALNAFKYSASGYILKPIDDLELANALDNAIQRITVKKANKEIHSSPVSDNKIGIPDGKSINYVNMNDIIYLESVKSYTKIVTTTTEILSAYNIGKYKDLLPEAIFYQVHRSFIVNLNRVSRYEMSGTLFMDNRKEIPVSKKGRDHLFAFFTRVKASPKI